MEFWKFSSAGNDFICIDNRDGSCDRYLSTGALRKSLARTLCARSTGIGADGLAIVAAPEIPAHNRISSVSLESDGSECELCGNCMASLTRYAFETGLCQKRRMHIETPAGTVNTTIAGRDDVSLTIPPPEHYRPGIQLSFEDRDILCDYIVAGIPHTATYVDNIEGLSIDKPGYFLRHHEAFEPRGVNANFVQVIKEGEIAVRTWEFGVEGETLSCGTGSCASAMMTALRFNWNGTIAAGKTPVLVRARSGETIRVYVRFDEATGTLGEIRFETRVRMIMRGIVDRAWLETALT